MWNYKIKKISVLSTFKFTLIYGVLFGTFLGIVFGLFSGLMATSFRFFGFSILGGFFAGLLYGVSFSFVSSLSVFIFNIISAWIDGIDIYVEKIQ